MNPRSYVLFLPSLLLFGFASYNIAKKRGHARQEVAQVVMAEPAQPIAQAAPSRAPASFGQATVVEVKPAPAIERLSLAFAQDLLEQRLIDKKLPLPERLSALDYEDQLKDLTEADGYPDHPEIFLRRLCEKGTSGACPLLWNLWQQPGTNDESVTRKTAVLLLSCIETGNLCRQALEAHRGTTLEPSIASLLRTYCDAGLKSACEEQRAPASAQPTQPADEHSQILRRCEDDSAADCLQIAILEAREKNLEAANDYAEFSCAAGLTEGCLELAKIQKEKRLHARQ